MKKSYSTSCASTTECNDLVGLTCPNATGKCNCPLTSSSIFCECKRDLNNEFYWDGQSCQPSKPYNQACNNQSTSYMCQTFTQGTICNNSCILFTCQCPYLQYFDVANNKCNNQLTFNQTCNSSISDMCQISFGLRCALGICR